MKILLSYNYYGSSAPSGENQVFEAEKAMLQARGHEVECFIPTMITYAIGMITAI
jgi:hypothetical protein